MAYDGFISYSHASDGALAPALQRALQRFAKPWNTRRALRIFRDETGLSTNPHLWAAIETALDESEWFVLLASPEAAQSEWVNREISCWLAKRSVERILPVVTGGSWEWDPIARDFTADSSAVPAALRGAMRDEPRHLDMRWARSETDLDLRNSRFRSALADLAAPMHGVAKDDLEGEDIRQHRRTRRLARGGVSVLTLLVVISIVVSGLAVAQRNRARSATAEANVERNQANTNAAAAEHELLLSESQALLGSNRQLATLLAIEADRTKPGADTRDALLRSALAQPLLQRTFASDARGHMGALLGHRVVVFGANRATADNASVLEVWDWQTGRRQAWRDAPLANDATRPISLSTTADGRLLAVVAEDGMIQIYSGRTLEPEGRPFPSGIDHPANVVLSPGGQSLAVSGNDPTATVRHAGRFVSVFSRVDNRWVSDPPLAGDNAPVATIAFGSDGNVVASASPTRTGNNILVSDVTSGRRLFSFAADPGNSIALDWARRRIVETLPTGGAGDAVWYDISTPVPSPHVIDVGGSSAGGGYALAAYDSTGSRLGINSSNGFGIFDATTFTPLRNLPVLPTDSLQAPFLFLDATHILTGSSGTGPVSLWDLTGTSVLATHTSAEFNNIYPNYPTPVPDRFFGTSTLGNERSVTILGPDYRPLGPRIPIEQDLRGLPAEARNAIGATLPAVACADSRGERIATVSVATGDIVTRGAAPPFRVLSRAPGVAARLADPLLCAWSPDGRQIAIGTYPRSGQAASIALYDVASKALRFVEPIRGEVAVVSLAYSRDGKELWIGGTNTSSSNGAYLVTDLDRTPRTTIAFPGAVALSADADRRRLVVLYPNSVRVFDARTLKALTQRIVLTGAITYDVDSAPDGREAVVQSGYGWRLIDLDAQQPIGPWISAPFPSAAYIGAHATTVYTEAHDGSGEIWDLTPANVRAAACGLAGRNLTEQEWHQYLAWSGPDRATCPQYPRS